MVPNQKYLMNKYKCLYFQAIFRFHFKIGAFYVWFSQPIRPSSWHFKRQNVKLSEVWFADHRMKVFFKFFQSKTFVKCENLFTSASTAPFVNFSKFIFEWYNRKHLVIWKCELLLHECEHCTIWLYQNYFFNGLTERNS